MQHLSEATLRSYMAGEMRPAGRDLVASHLTRCRACRDVVARVSEAVGPGWTGPGGPASSVSLGDAVRWEVARALGARQGSARRRRLAAVALVALLAGGASALAAPGSPLRGLVTRLFF